MTIAIFFGQFGPYHHARVLAVQRLLKKEAMNRVREELTRQFGRASGIVAEVQSDDGKGNIVVDVTQLDTSSVRAANND
jgi:hypothetical protein